MLFFRQNDRQKERESRENFCGFETQMQKKYHMGNKVLLKEEKDKKKRVTTTFAIQLPSRMEMAQIFTGKKYTDKRVSSQGTQMQGMTTCGITHFVGANGQIKKYRQPPLQ